MRTSRRLLLVLFLAALFLSGCYASVGMSIPIGSPYGYGYGAPMGSIHIGSGPIYW
jgi:hypothetical protein